MIANKQAESDQLEPEEGKEDAEPQLQQWLATYFYSYSFIFSPEKWNLGLGVKRSDTR